MPRPRRKVPGLILILAAVAGLLAAVGAVAYAYYKAATIRRPTKVSAAADATDLPYTLVLGVAQDAGIPQAGAFEHPAWTNPDLRRHAVCLAIVDPRAHKRWIIDATPDLRPQLYNLHEATRAGRQPDAPILDGIFLTHAHIGHYTGLMFLGHESIGAHAIPVHAMPRMAEFLRTNGPWDQLVRYDNIDVRPLTADEPVRLADDLTITPIPVPHRQEYSETVAFRIDGPTRSILWLPDIDSWREWDEWGVTLEDVLKTVDVAYVDGTFFADGEIPGRDMSTFPHPFMTTTIERLAPLPRAERAKIRFIHLNHTNPAQSPESDAAQRIRAAGMAVTEEGEQTPL